MSADVLDSNDAFYRAIREGDYGTMDTLWAHQRRVSCTHPGWTQLNRRDAIMDSWHMILFEPNPPQIWIAEPRAILTGGTAMVLCVERLGGAELLASNAFVIEEGAWRMVNHQAEALPMENAR